MHIGLCYGAGVTHGSTWGDDNYEGGGGSKDLDKTYMCATISTPLDHPMILDPPI